MFLVLISAHRRYVECFIPEGQSDGHIIIVIRNGYGQMVPRMHGAGDLTIRIRNLTSAMAGDKQRRMFEKFLSVYKPYFSGSGLYGSSTEIVLKVQFLYVKIFRYDNDETRDATHAVFSFEYKLTCVSKHGFTSVSQGMPRKAKGSLRRKSAARSRLLDDENLELDIKYIQGTSKRNSLMKTNMPSFQSLPASLSNNSMTSTVKSDSHRKNVPEEKAELLPLYEEIELSAASREMMEVRATDYGQFHEIFYSIHDETKIVFYRTVGRKNCQTLMQKVSRTTCTSRSTATSFFMKKSGRMFSKIKIFFINVVMNRTSMMGTRMVPNPMRWSKSALHPRVSMFTFVKIKIQTLSKCMIFKKVYHVGTHTPELKSGQTDERLSVSSQPRYSPTTYPDTPSTFISTDDERETQRGSALQKAARVTEEMGLETLSEFIRSADAGGDCINGPCRWSETCERCNYKSAVTSPQPGNSLESESFDDNSKNENELTRFREKQMKSLIGAPVAYTPTKSSDDWVDPTEEVDYDWDESIRTTVDRVPDDGDVSRRIRNLAKSTGLLKESTDEINVQKSTPRKKNVHGGPVTNALWEKYLRRQNVDPVNAEGNPKKKEKIAKKAKKNVIQMYELLSRSSASLPSPEKARPEPSDMQDEKAAPDNVELASEARLRRAREKSNLDKAYESAREKANKLAAERTKAELLRKKELNARLEAEKIRKEAEKKQASNDADDVFTVQTDMNQFISQYRRSNLRDVRYEILASRSKIVVNKRPVCLKIAEALNSMGLKVVHTAAAEQKRCPDVNGNSTIVTYAVWRVEKDLAGSALKDALAKLKAYGLTTMSALLREMDTHVYSMRLSDEAVAKQFVPSTENLNMIFKHAIMLSPDTPIQTFDFVEVWYLGSTNGGFERTFRARVKIVYNATASRLPKRPPKVFEAPINMSPALTDAEVSSGAENCMTFIAYASETVTAKLLAKQSGRVYQLLPSNTLCFSRGFFVKNEQKLLKNFRILRKIPVDVTGVVTCKERVTTCKCSPALRAGNPFVWKTVKENKPSPKLEPIVRETEILGKSAVSVGRRGSKGNSRDVKTQSRPEGKNCSRNLTIWPVELRPSKKVLMSGISGDLKISTKLHPFLKCAFYAVFNIYKCSKSSSSIKSRIIFQNKVQEILSVIYSFSSTIGADIFPNYNSICHLSNKVIRKVFSPVIRLGLWFKSGAWERLVWMPLVPRRRNRDCGWGIRCTRRCKFKKR